MTTKVKAKNVFSQLAQDHLRALEAGKAGYKRSDELLDELVAAGAPIGKAIRLKSGEDVVIDDQFSDGNRVGYGGAVRRYKIRVLRATDITSKL